MQKHAKTHSNLRPYTCRYCAFAFKTKGNLTKHMKSKAHHKKCVEIGVVPVPTNVEDLAYLSPEANSALSRVSLKPIHLQVKVRHSSGLDISPDFRK